MEREIKKVNRDNGFFLSRKRRIRWIVLEVILLGLAILTLYLAVRTKADEGVGSGWREHQLGEPDTTLEGGAEGDSASAFSPDPSVWRPCPWDGEDTSSVTESEGETIPDSAPDSVETSSEEGRGTDEMIYHSRPNDRMEIALSFDDGPHPRLTPVILSILEEYGIKATFFMVGENVGYYPAAARAVVEAGHEIGNHTYTHAALNLLDRGALEREILDSEALIEKCIGTRPTVFRPPGGKSSSLVESIVTECDGKIILWDVDPRDWTGRASQEIVDAVLRDTVPGSIILFHDYAVGHSTTVTAIKEILPRLSAAGYRFVTVTELLSYGASTGG